MPGETVEERVSEALLNRMTAYDADGVDVVWPNMMYPERGEMREARYYVVSLAQFPTVRRRISGPHSSQHSGVLQVSVLVPLGVGGQEPLLMAGRVAAHFPADAVYASGTTAVQILKDPHVAAGYEDRGFWRTPVNIEYSTLSI